MSATSNLYLTEDRIRAVVRDTPRFAQKARGAARKGSYLSIPHVAWRIAAGGSLINYMGDQFDSSMGPGAGQHMADSSRLRWLLEILERGTIEEVIGVEQRGLAEINSKGLDPVATSGIRGSMELQIAHLRSIPQREIDAVMSCLDEIATIHAGSVRTIRLRHELAERERLVHEAGSLRTGDPSRPQLTEERVHWVLGVLSQLIPGPKKFAIVLRDSPYMSHNRTAAQLFPVSVMKKITAQGEDPDAFARDLFWIRLIAVNVGRADSIDTSIAELMTKQGADAWLNPAEAPAKARQRAEKFAAMMSLPLETLCRIGRDEEAVIRSLLDVINDVLRRARETPPSRRGKAFKE